MSVQIHQQGKQEEDPLYNFINSLSNPNTREKYLIHLNKFLAGRNPTELLALPIADLERIIVQYLIKMKTEKLSTSYIRLAFAAIKHLCIMNDVRINKEKISKFIGGERTELHHDRPYNHEEIQKLLSVCDLRFQVLRLI